MRVEAVMDGDVTPCGAKTKTPDKFHRALLETCLTGGEPPVLSRAGIAAFVLNTKAGFAT
jgi:hypothetical protein